MQIVIQWLQVGPEFCISHRLSGDVHTPGHGPHSRNKMLNHHHILFWRKMRPKEGRDLLKVTLLARAAITKHHRLHGLNYRNLFSHNSGVWKSKIKVTAEVVSGEGSLLGLEKATFSLCAHRALPQCLPAERERVCWCLFL